ncbi:MAG TPA: UDP-galactopyranose mutase [Ruminococcaceae bacterium]|nr:UDP-galactopyranose mutase [Oscillospiraceae bacterium]
MKKVDFLIVGAGLFGSVFAHEAISRGKSCLIVEKRNHVGGNVYTDQIEGIHVHTYGPHIFHTSNSRVWEFMNRFATFSRFTLNTLANYKGEIYNLPFNMNTFNRMWGVITPDEALRKIEEQRESHKTDTPKNLEEQAINLVGTDIYEKLIKGYTEKQWGRPCKVLPAFIIKRLPVRFTYDNNYFNDPYQGIPVGGYTHIIKKLLSGVQFMLNTDYLMDKERFDSIAEKVIYTGPIDAYFEYRFGELEYRSIRLETQTLNCTNYQGNAVINYTDRETPYTRIIEHKHFEPGTQSKTVISREYPAEWKKGDEPFYPVNDERNQALYKKYAALARAETNVIFGGRLGEFKYYDMDKVVESALVIAEKVLV